MRRPPVTDVTGLAPTSGALWSTARACDRRGRHRKQASATMPAIASDATPTNDDATPAIAALGRLTAPAGAASGPRARCPAKRTDEAAVSAAANEAPDAANREACMPDVLDANGRLCPVDVENVSRSGCLSTMTEQVPGVLRHASHARKSFERMDHHGEACDGLVLLRRGRAGSAAKTRTGNNGEKTSGVMGR
jgi:hypothetical protein